MGKLKMFAAIQSNGGVDPHVMAQAAQSKTIAFASDYAAVGSAFFIAFLLLSFIAFAQITLARAEPSKPSGKTGVS